MPIVSLCFYYDYYDNYGNSYFMNLPLKEVNLSMKYPNMCKKYPLISKLWLFCFGCSFLLHKFVKMKLTSH